MKQAPTRWKDSGDPAVRDLLRAGRPTRAIPETNRTRGARRVARIASVPALGLGVGLLSKAAAAGFALGAASAVAVVATVPSVREKLGAAVVLPRSRLDVVVTTPHASEPTSVLPIAAPIVESPAVAETTPPKPTVRPEAPHKIAPAPPAEIPPTEPPATAPPAAPDDRMSSEVALLLEARRQLATDPEAALAALSRHAESFPTGSLAMERDVLAVEALAQAGRGDEASHRASEILARAPSSFYSARLRRFSR